MGATCGLGPLLVSDSRLSASRLIVSSTRNSKAALAGPSLHLPPDFSLPLGQLLIKPLPLLIVAHGGLGYAKQLIWMSTLERALMSHMDPPYDDLLFAPSPNTGWTECWPSCRLLTAFNSGSTATLELRLLLDCGVRS